MRIGPLEIIIIIIIITVVLLIARIVRFNSYKNKEPSPDILVLSPKHKKTTVWSYFKRAGITFVIAGILFGLAGISMLRWAVQGYILALILMVLGIVLILISRKK